MVYTGGLLFALLWRRGNHSSPGGGSGSICLGDATEVKCPELRDVTDDVLSVACVALYGVPVEGQGFESAQAGELVDFGNPPNVVAV